METKDFGLLLQALRKSSLDDGGKRWSRASLSRAIHLTPTQLGRLERGDRKYIDTQTLSLLAKSFNLTNLEQREFFTAALANSDVLKHDLGAPDTSLRETINILEQLKIPGYVVDCYGDIVAANRSVMQLFGITPELVDYTRNIRCGYNILYFVYAPELGYRELVKDKWRQSADTVLLFFRRITLRYRHREYFDLLLEDLLKIRQFDIDWYTNHRLSDHLDLTYEYIGYTHPQYGSLKYITTETVIYTSAGELYLILYNPTNNATFKAFNHLVNEHGNHVLRLARWPEKNY